MRESLVRKARAAARLLYATRGMLPADNGGEHIAQGARILQECAREIEKLRATLAASVSAPAQQAEAPLSDAELARIAYAGFDAYWTEDCKGIESEAWAASAKAVLAAAATAPSVEAQADMSNAARDVLAERRRQVEVEGWTPEHDDEHSNGELAYAAAAYAVASVEKPGTLVEASKLFMHTGWAKHWWKPSTPQRDLEKAAALILAELERRHRAALKESQR